MILNESIDIYCERVSSDIFAEPINFITNFAFIIVYILLYRRYKKRVFNSKVEQYYSLILIFLILFIGFGSLLFHLLGTVLSAIADVVPNMIFIILYLYLSVKFFLNCSQRAAIFSIGIFLIFNTLLTALGVEEIASYLLALFSMLLISILSYKKKE